MSSDIMVYMLEPSCACSDVHDSFLKWSCSVAVRLLGAVGSR
jgi:hypothetical protein